MTQQHPNPRDLIKRLADALHDAADDVEGWGNYASSYFQEKHDLRGNVARIYAEAAEAYAYLAQSDPEEPTVMEIIDLSYEIEQEGLGRVDLVRRALARWGRSPQ